MHNLFKSIGYAIKGIRLSLNDRNKKIQVACAFIAIGLGFLFQITGVEWCIILFSMALILSLEMVNTAIERTVDYISTEHNEKAGKIKDIAAGAVLMASIFVVIIGFIIFGKYIIALF